MPNRWSREGGERITTWDPPTQEPGGGSRVASLPAGPLPSQLVTFPSGQASCWKPSCLSRGPGAESQPLPGVALTQPHPSPFPPAFPPRKNHSGTLRVPSTPSQVQAPLSGCCPNRTQDPGPRVRAEVGAKSGLVSCWEYFVSHSLIFIFPAPPPPFHGGG